MPSAKAVLDRIRPSHPTLYDGDHVLEAYLGMSTVSMWIWVDEDGAIVRAPEFVHVAPAEAEKEQPAPPPTQSSLAPELLASMSHYASRLAAQGISDLDAVRDWVKNGSDSVY